MQLSLFGSAPPGAAAVAPASGAMWISSYHVLKNNGTRKLWYYRFYWQEGSQTHHVHIPGGAVGSLKVERYRKDIQAMIDCGKSADEICKVIRSWSEGRGSNLNRNRFMK